MSLTYQFPWLVASSKPCTQTYIRTANSTLGKHVKQKFAKKCVLLVFRMTGCLHSSAGSTKIKCTFPLIRSCDFTSNIVFNQVLNVEACSPLQLIVNRAGDNRLCEIKMRGDRKRYFNITLALCRKTYHISNTH